MGSVVSSDVMQRKKPLVAFCLPIINCLIDLYHSLRAYVSLRIGHQHKLIQPVYILRYAPETECLTLIDSPLAYILLRQAAIKTRCLHPSFSLALLHQLSVILLSCTWNPPSPHTFVPHTSPSLLAFKSCILYDKQSL